MVSADWAVRSLGGPPAASERATAVRCDHSAAVGGWTSMLRPPICEMISL